MIVPRYDPAAETALTRLSETEAFFMLALHAVNLLPTAPSGPRRWAGWPPSCECYALRCPTSTRRAGWCSGWWPPGYAAGAVPGAG